MSFSNMRHEIKVEHQSPEENVFSPADPSITIVNASFFNQGIFSPPPLPPTWIRRELSQKQLVRISNSNVIVYQAPAGTGKTTCMLQYLNDIKQRGVSTVWLNLQPSFNKPRLFMQTLNRAVQIALNQPHQTDQQWDSYLSVFDAANTGRPFVIFLDKLDVLTNADSLILVRNLLESLPTNGKVVASTRALPNLNFSRLRAYGNLTEIGMKDLLFSRHETHLLLTKLHGASPREDEVSTLHQITHGWAAGIHLASLEASPETANAPSHSIPGPRGTMHEFLDHEVFAHVPTDMQKLLVQTAILKDLSAPLCNHLFGSNRGAELIDHATRNSLFLLPIDNQHSWFRFHRVMQYFLREKLQSISLDMTATLHARAAHWHWQHQNHSDAIYHALLARDQQLIGKFLTTHLPVAFNNCQFRHITEWHALLPAGTLDSLSELSHYFAATLALVGKHQEASALLCASTSNPPRPAEPEQELGQCFAKLIIHITSDTPFNAALFPRNMEAASLSPQQKRFLEFIHGSIHHRLGNFDRSREKLEECKTTHLQDMPEAQLLCIAATDIEIASMELVRGNLNFSKAIATRIIERGEHQQNFGITNTARIFSAKVLHEQGDITTSAHLLESFVPRHIALCFPDQIILGLLTQSRNMRLLGNQVHANDLLIELAELGAKKSLPRLTASAWLEMARIAIDDDNLEIAREHLSRANKHIDWTRSRNSVLLGNETLDPELITLRLLIKENGARDATVLADSLIPQSHKMQRLFRMLKLNILKCMALRSLGDQQSSSTLFYRAISCASRNHLVRIFADEASPPLTALIDDAYEHALLRSHTNAEHEQNRNLIAEIRRAASICGQPAPSAKEQESPAQIPTSHGLTKSELRILTLLSLGISNAEIAKRAHLSVATVNAHLRNIYSKLNTSNRMQTVTIARNSGLV